MNSSGHILQAWWMILRAVRRHKFTAKSSARPELSLLTTLHSSSASCPDKSTQRNSVTSALCSVKREEYIMYCSLCCNEQGWLNDAELKQQISSLALTHRWTRPRHPQRSGRCSSFLLVAAYETVHSQTLHPPVCVQMSAVGITENVKGDMKKFEVWYNGREEVYIIQVCWRRTFHFFF